MIIYVTFGVYNNGTHRWNDQKFEIETNTVSDIDVLLDNEFWDELECGDEILYINVNDGKKIHEFKTVEEFATWYDVTY